jgi:hypothetical protein
VDRRSPDPRQVLRVVAVALLLVLAALGVAAMGTVPLRAEPPLVGGSQGLGPVIAVVLVVVVLASVALSARRRRRGRSISPGPVRRMSPLRMLAGLILFTAAAMLFDLGERLRERFGSGAPADGQSGDGGGGAGLSVVSRPALATIAVLVAVVVLLVLVGVLALRRPAAFLATAEDATPELDEGDALTSALDAGAAALREPSDPRDAIVACYVAMERSLADAGERRRTADTPEELLARARAGGLVRSSAADELTRLFSEARFSRHPMGFEEREAARIALARLRAEVERR